MRFSYVKEDVAKLLKVTRDSSGAFVLPFASEYAIIWPLDHFEVALKGAVFPSHKLWARLRMLPTRSPMMTDEAIVFALGCEEGWKRLQCEGRLHRIHSDSRRPLTSHRCSIFALLVGR